MKKIAVFASGNGSNMDAIIGKCEKGFINGRVALVISNNRSSGALKKAKDKNIRNFCISPRDFADPEKYDEKLLELCLDNGIDLICLAGFMLKIGKKLLGTYNNRIMNIHPALLPAFGGKGMYGMNVHKAVVKSGVSVTGATVHFVNEKYDAGPIVLQKAVFVRRDDTPETLAERVLKAEHRVYPEAVRLFCAGRLKIMNGKVLISKGARESKRALISVSDKTGIAGFARELENMGFEIISTSGTARLLEKEGIRVTPLEALTGFPEMLGGRVKTLNPFVHGGILADAEKKRDAADMAALGLEKIDIVAVNLYPFADVAKREKRWSAELIENIDIGGVTLLRAAAKNYRNSAPVCDAGDYPEILEELKNHGYLREETRKRLSLKSFRHTYEYEREIFAKLSGKNTLLSEKPVLMLEKEKDLRYGENPHQKAAYFTIKGESVPFRQIAGRDLSYNNLLDAYSAAAAAAEFDEAAVVVVKHLTPCGIGKGKTAYQALERAWSCDPMSAFGGIVFSNRRIDRKFASFLEKKFIEVLCAPSFSGEALEIFKKKKNLRILVWKRKTKDKYIIKSVGKEILIQENDRTLFAGRRISCPTKRKPTRRETSALEFAWKCVKHVKSNAIVICDEHRTLGIGAGQMSRVDASFMAARKYRIFLKNNSAPSRPVLASDAFFPFPDAVREAAKAGVKAIIQPGGSVRDREVIKEADRLKIAMLFTGTRHFRH